MTDLNVDALFLGPKSENRKFFKEIADFLLDEHIHWRRDFHPEDDPAVSVHDRHEESFRATLDRTEQALLDLTNKLKVSSMPWFSARYLGHMNSDTLMVANLAYIAAMLYNPNNVAYEGSPATTELEIEVGKQLAQLFGYEPKTAWGHITADGSIANYEGLWVARNVKSIPLAVKQVRPELVDGLDEWQLLNLSVNETLNMGEKVKAADAFDEVRDHSVRGTGVQGDVLGKLLVPQSKHYSWTKAADILGVGQEHTISVQVQDDYRIDVDHLKEVIDGLIAEKTPILAVVSVMGTTEEGAVDELHRIVELRSQLEEQGVSFYLHVDAAYGGYARTILKDEYNELIPQHEVKDKLHDSGVMSAEIDWPSDDVYNAFAATAHADSITVDPHKMGYVPYAAGAVVMRDRRVLDLISYFAAYVFEKSEDNPMLLGSYIMEGSKAGATAAAVWTAHHAVPLNVTGYGRIMGRSIEGANHFYNSLVSCEPFEIDGKTFQVRPLVKPDFNIVDFAFNEDGNTSLEKMNDLNQRIYDLCSYRSGPVYADEFITSKTELTRDSYGEVPRGLAEKLGIPAEEWDSIHSVYVLRSCVLTPWLAANTTYEEYWAHFLKTMKDKVATAANAMSS